jgi:hypothetical protein
MTDFEAAKAILADAPLRSQNNGDDECKRLSVD